MEVEQSVLKVKEGRFVTVKDLNSTLTLCAVDTQKAPGVCIWKREEGERIQMAFRFQYGNGYYFAKVNGDSLKVELASSESNNLSDNHWFVKKDEKNGEHYILESVVTPKRYLCYIREHKHYVFILSANKSEGAMVTDKSIS